MIELDAIIDKTYNYTLSGIALRQTIVGSVPSLVGLDDAFSHIGE